MSSSLLLRFPLYSDDVPLSPVLVYTLNLRTVFVFSFFSLLSFLTCSLSLALASSAKLAIKNDGRDVEIARRKPATRDEVEASNVNNNGHGDGHGDGHGAEENWSAEDVWTFARGAIASLTMRVPRNDRRASVARCGSAMVAGGDRQRNVVTREYSDVVLYVKI